MRRGAFLAAIIAVAVVGLSSGTAQAGVGVYAEPAYTKTAGNNSYWFQWAATTGVNDGDGSANYSYFLCIKTYVADNYSNPAENSNGTAGPGSSNCTGLVRSNSSQPSSGNVGFYPFQSNTVLADNTSYEMCVTGFYWYVFYWRYDSPTGCARTVIDRSAPTAGISLAGGAAYTNNANLPIRINYNDAISPPWRDTNGLAFTWGCLSRGGPCNQPATVANSWSWHKGCSVPAAQQRITVFECAWDLSAEPDGAYHYCANVADFGVPDNPNGINQFIATADQANRSAIACDSTMLDRGAPVVTLSPSATTVNAGDLVTFTAGATDSHSGVTGNYAWTFGDNTAPGSGANTSHTYTQPGTYIVKVTTADGAGNPGEATRTITVNPAPSGGNPPGDGGTQTTTTPTTTTTTTTPTTTTTTPTTTTTTTTTPTTTTTTPTTTTTTTPTTNTSGSSTNTSSGVTETTTTKVTEEIQKSSSGTQSKSLGSVLGVLAPKTFRLKGRKPALLLGLTATKPGRLSIQLLRGKKVVARKAANLGRKGVFSLRLPLAAGLPSGAYKLKLTFKPAAGGTFTKTLALTIKRAKARAVAAGIVRPRHTSLRAPRPSRAESRRGPDLGRVSP